MEENLPEVIGKGTRLPKWQEVILHDEIWTLYCHGHDIASIARHKNVDQRTVRRVTSARQKEAARHRDPELDLIEAVSAANALRSEGWQWLSILRNNFAAEQQVFEEQEEKKKAWCAANNKGYSRDSRMMLRFLTESSRSVASLIDSIGHQEDRLAKLKGLWVTQIAGAEGKPGILGDSAEKMMKALTQEITIIIPDADPEVVKQFEDA